MTSSVMIILDHHNVKYSMTDKESEYHSLKETYKLLCMIIDPQKTPRIPAEVRAQAKHCLRFYPIRSEYRELIETVEFFNPR